MAFDDTERRDAVEFAHGQARQWLNAADIMNKGGDPGTPDLIEVGRELQGSETAVSQFLQKIVQDTID